MKTHARCRGCGRRKFLQKDPKLYKVQPQCESCGRRSWRADKWKNDPARKKDTCHGLCRHYPHRRGSKKCYDLKDGTPKPHDQLYEELYADLDPYDGTGMY